MEPRRHAHRLYLHPDRGWTPDPDGALMRLDAQTRVRPVAEARNQLLAPDGHGGWAAVSDERARSARERGLVWFGWQTMAAGVPYLAFKGVRVVDEQLATGLLDGLAVRDENGERLADPAAAAHIFLLSVEDAKEFHGRVKRAGGEVHRGDPLPDSATNAAAVIDKAAAALSALDGEDEELLAEARAGNFAGRGAFERRHEAYSRHVQHARGALAECERATSAASAPGRSVAEQAAAAALRDRARAGIDRCLASLERREGAEREYAWLVAGAEGRLSETENPAVRLLLFRELGRVAAEQGMEVSETPAGVRVRTKFGWLELGPGFRFDD